MAKERDDSEDFDPEEVARTKKMQESMLERIDRETNRAMNKVNPDEIQAFKHNPHPDDYQQIATQFAFYPGKGYPLGLLYVGLKMNGEAGEFAEHVGKAMRDDNYGVTTNRLSAERRLLLIKEIGDNLWYCAAACTELGITLSEAMGENLDKLLSRQQRNVQSGSGDNR